jgi:hypothetical protein
VFQKLSSGFIPDVFGGDGFNYTALFLGVASVAALVYFGFRSRANQIKHEVETAPFGLFAFKNALLAVLVVAFCYLMATYRGLPNVLVIMALLIGLYAFVTNRTTIGRRIYALGGNEKAAKLSGIKTERLTFLTFVNMGVLAGLAGLIFAARLNTATPKAGLGFELDVIAAVFIGGGAPPRRGRPRTGLRHRRRRQGHGRGDRRLRDGRHEQRHVHSGHRHRLSAGHQRPRAAHRRVPGRLLQEEVTPARMVQTLSGSRY